MSRTRIYSHITMWAVILSGALLSFLFFPGKYLFPVDSKLSSIAAVPLIVIMLYYLIKSVALHFKLKSRERKEENLVQAGIYGRFEHPTCTCLVFFFWIIFLFFPDVRMFIGNIWITAVIVIFLEIEKSVYRKKQSGEERPDLGP